MKKAPKKRKRKHITTKLVDKPLEWFSQKFGSFSGIFSTVTWHNNQMRGDKQFGGSKLTNHLTLAGN
jgi:catalase (peroxidase I)